MARGLWTGVLLGAVLAGGACGGSSGDDDDDLIFEIDAGPPPIDAAPGDDNDSFDDAIPVDVGGAGKPGVIDEPGDQDFFVFEGTAGQWLELSALPDDLGSGLIPIVTLYDAAKAQLGDGFILATRLAASGTYYVKVEDISSLYGDPMPLGGPDATYLFEVVEAADGLYDYYFDTELGDDAASAVPVPGSIFTLTTLAGLFDHADDRDVYSVTFAGAGTKRLSAYVGFPGSTGNGSTSDFGALWVTDATGSEIIARIDADAFEIDVPLPSPGSYLLWVDKDATAPASNDFYLVDLFGGFEDDAAEKETVVAPGTNDTIALADANDELIPLSTSSSTYFIAYLPAGDVDYIAFDATSALAIEAYCVAADFGSGLVGMSAQIRDAADQVLSSSTEPGLGFLDTALPAAGRYYFRLSAMGQDPEVTGNWVRCNLRVPSF